MYKIIVCDDNREFVEVLTRLINRYVSLYDAEVIGFSTGGEVLEYCRDNRCDIIYMDIEVGTDNGMSIAKTLKRMYPHMLIIYISAYDNYYTDMVQAEPFRFIPKDMSNMQRFEKTVADTLEVAISRITGSELWSYEFRRRQYVIELGQVRYFHSFGRKIYIVGDTGDAPNYCYGKMDDLQRELEKAKANFGRVNKSYMVNMRYARYTGTDKVIIDDNTALSISDNYRKKFNERYIQYWEEKF